MSRLLYLAPRVLHAARPACAWRPARTGSPGRIRGARSSAQGIRQPAGPPRLPHHWPQSRNGRAPIVPPDRRAISSPPDQRVSRGDPSALKIGAQTTGSVPDACGERWVRIGGVSMEEGQDTFPRLLLHHAKVRPTRPPRARRTSASGRRGPGARSPTRCARSPAGWPRRASSAAMHLAIIGDNRPRLYWSMVAAQCAGRRPGADVPGRAGRRDCVYVLNDAEIALRDRRGPGAGRQAARGAGRRCRRSRTSTTTTRAACATTTGVTSYERLQRDRPRVRPRASRLLRRARSRKGQRRRRVGHALHVGHDRQAEGRVPDARARSSPPRGAAASSTS